MTIQSASNAPLRPHHRGVAPSRPLRRAAILLAAAGTALAVNFSGAQQAWHYEAANPGVTIPQSPSNSEITALVEWTDGSTKYLVAAGLFTTAGGTSASRIAKWNGTSWSTFGTNITFNGAIKALAVYNGDLYIGGSFTQIGTAAIPGIARWNGSAWTSVGTAGAGATGSVQTLLVFDDDGSGPNPPKLYAGGTFNTISGLSYRNLAKWDTISWTPVGGDVNGTVYALASYDDDGAGPHPAALYAGGTFFNVGITTSTPGGISATRIAKWQGGAWSAVGPGLNDDVWALATHNDGAGDKLYAGGKFIQPLGGNLGNMTHVGAWNGTTWSKLAGASGEGVDGGVYSLVSYADSPAPNTNSLYIGGDFTHAGGVSASHIARWHAGAWDQLRLGTNGRVYALLPRTISTDPGLYAAGRFSIVDNAPANNIARWTLIDCNHNGVDDATDIASGTSFDCNRNGVPDECDIGNCLLVQSQMPQGNFCGAFPPSGAWQQHITLKRAWFTRDGDPLWWQGEGRFVWKNRPEHSATIIDQYTSPQINLGQVEHKIERNPKRDRHCTGRHTYRWNDLGYEIYFNDGPNDQDIINNISENRINLDIEVHEQDRKYLFVTLDAVMLAVRAFFDVFESVVNLTFSPTWVNLSEGFIFLKNDLNAVNDRIIARKQCPGLAVNAFPHANPPCKESTEDGNPVPVCEGSGTDSTVNFLFSDTPHDKYAMGQYLWTTKLGSGYQGQQIFDPSFDAVLPRNGGDEILRYEFFQRSGSELACRAIFAGIAQCDQVWPGMTAGETRVLHYYFDIDTNPATGGTNWWDLGADYECRVTQRRKGTTNLLESSVQLLSYCAGHAETIASPVLHFEPNKDRIEVGIDTASIGLCPGNFNFSSWIVLDHNNAAAKIDTCPNAPNLQSNRHCLAISADAECPRLVAINQQIDANGDMNGIHIAFSERVKPLSSSDILLDHGGPVSVTITMQNSDTAALITPLGGGNFKSGSYVLTVRDSVTDLAGNRLDGDDDGVCGGEADRYFCNHKAHGFAKTASEEDADAYAPNTPIYFQGDSLPPSTNVDVYVTRKSSLRAPGAILIDQTSDGANTFNTGAAGALNHVSLGSIPQRGQYYFVVDVNRNGRWDPNIDTACSECGTALTVGEPCEDTFGDPLAYWTFDEPTPQRAVAEMISGNDAVVTGSPVPVPAAGGAPGSALRFGPNDSLTVADSEDVNLDANDFTIEFWINKTSIADNFPILSKTDPNNGALYSLDSNGGNLNLILCSGGAFGVCSNYPTTSSPITPGVWHHVAFTADSAAGVASIYIDGVLNASYPFLGIDAFNTGPLHILPPSPSRISSMMLDEMVFLESVLTPTDILKIYQTASHCNTSNPCPADFNNDGGIDGSDVDAFMQAWSAGITDADVNLDGGIDGSDVVTFFVAWENGGC